MHASKPKKILHFDYCHMESGQGGYRYFLILKDNLSQYVMLNPTVEADTDTTNKALIVWFTTFGVANNRILDNVTHIKKNFIKHIKENLQSHYHLTLPCCPWANSWAKVVCRELLRCPRALQTELPIPKKSLLSVIALIQLALYNAPTRGLKCRCSHTIFTVLQQQSTLPSTEHKWDRKPTHSVHIDVRRGCATMKIENCIFQSN